MVHFPIAGAFFAAAALAIGVARPAARSASLNAAGLLLGAAVAGGIAAAVSGWLWADQLAYLAGGWGPIPGPKAVEGLARQHALLAISFVAVASVALGFVLAARRRERPPILALFAAVLACGLVAATGHLGGTMVHAPPAPSDEAAPPAAR
jgi:hypothetical protein